MPFERLADEHQKLSQEGRGFVLCGLIWSKIHTFRHFVAYGSYPVLLVGFPTKHKKTKSAIPPAQNPLCFLVFWSISIFISTYYKRNQPSCEKKLQDKNPGKPLFYPKLQGKPWFSWSLFLRNQPGPILTTPHHGQWLSHSAGLRQPSLGAREDARAAGWLRSGGESAGSCRSEEGLFRGVSVAAWFSFVKAGWALQMCFK